jgi:hypothetical protein
VKPKLVADDPGFEVVDVPPPKKKPKVSVVDDDDTVEEPRAKAKTKRSRRLDDEDEAEAAREAGGRVDESDLSQFNDLKPGKKKLTAAEKKRIRAEKRRLEREEQQKNAEEWLFPSIVFGIGILLSLAAAVIIGAQSPVVGIAVLVMLVITLVESVLMIPLAVGALMVVGKLCGIEYGTLTHTVRSLAAIIAFDVGVYWFGASLFPLTWISWPIALVVGFIATYGLFMKFFDVDVMEARISIGAINFVTGVGTFLGWMLALAILVSFVASSRPASDTGPDPDDEDDPPVKVQNQQQWKEPAKGKGGRRPMPDDAGDDDN